MKTALLIPIAQLLRSFGDATMPIGEQIHTLLRRFAGSRWARGFPPPRLLWGQLELAES